MKKIVLLLLLSLVSASAGEITIAVAANVSYAIEALKKEFAVAYPQTQVQVILGSSGKLTAQIKHDAPYDTLHVSRYEIP